MRAVKTLVIGGCLFINFAAVGWSLAMILNGGTLGNTALISKSDAEVAIILLAFSVLANFNLTIALVRRRGLRKDLSRRTAAASAQFG